MIAKEVYGADGVDFAPEAVAKAKKFRERIPSTTNTPP